MDPHDRQPPRFSLKLGLILLAVWIAATVVGALIGLLALAAKLALLICAAVWAVHVLSVARRRDGG
jgi:predicted branched-subunit amino acid permease